MQRHTHKDKGKRCFGTFSPLLPLGSVLLYQQADVWRVTTHPSLHSCFHLQPTFLPSLTLPLSARHTLLAASMLLFSGTILLSRQIFFFVFVIPVQGFQDSNSFQFDLSLSHNRFISPELQGAKHKALFM